MNGAQIQRREESLQQLHAKLQAAEQEQGLSHELLADMQEGLYELQQRRDSWQKTVQDLQAGTMGALKVVLCSVPKEIGQSLSRPSPWGLSGR